MRVNESSQSSQPHTRGEVCIVIAGNPGEAQLGACMATVREHTHAGTSILRVAPTTADVNGALTQVAPADAVVLAEPCRVTPGWLERLRACALSDTNTATASALADRGTALALSRAEDPIKDLGRLADHLAEHTLRLRPRLRGVVGPCVYVRREALDLVGPLDEGLDLRSALEIDFAQRCLLSGLAHLAADDVVVGRLTHSPEMPAEPRSGAAELPAQMRERYPYLSQPDDVADSRVLARALEAVREPSSRLSVTIDARALDGVVTGTQLHILELALALADTGALRLRLLVREKRIDPQTLERLRNLPDTDLLSEDEVDEETPRSTVYHRPQQAFAHEDVELAVRLGERIVISQLDLIAYRNPGYFADPGAWEAYRRASRHGIAAAERVIVFSDHTRRDLLSDGLADEERIRIVPPGLDHRTATTPRRPEALDGRDVGEFLLCLGTDFRHKNRVFALRLLYQLRERHGWDGRLVLAGTHIPHGSSRALERVLLSDKPELRDAVLELGFVSEEEKTWLMREAVGLVYPSVYEGFGLVPFESALHRVPCMFAAQSSLAEAAPPGTATILPWDPAQSAAAAYALLTDPQARSQHIEALVATAKRLTWANAAAAMVRIYREAAVAPVRDAATLSRDAVERERELTAAHRAVAHRLIDEREHERGMYEKLNAEVSYGRSLVGPAGTLPDEVQRALLALSARPALSRPVYGVMARGFRIARVIARAIRRQPPPH
jgi:glycosyltransferase involved in cell wall biosynthesis